MTEDFSPLLQHTNRPEFLESFYKTGTFIDRSLEKTLETIK